MAKTRIAERLTARFKFKSQDLIEIVIMDSDTNDIYYCRWSFRDSKPEITKVEPTANTEAEEVTHND